MTTILLTPPPIAREVTAAQVVAYLLRPGSGWRKIAWAGARCFRRGDNYVFLVDNEVTATVIEDIARAEHRPAEQVATDIAGPVVGSVGVGTNDAIPIEEQWSCGECEFNPPRECAGTSPTPGEVYWAEAPSAPESEE